MSRAIAAVCVVLYNAFILGGTAWLVWHGWSPWWFLPAALFLAEYSSESK